jgi:triacylglycerol lipase
VNEQYHCNSRHFATYFYKVKDTLTAEGEIVYTPAVDPFNNSTYRGTQLIAQIEKIREETGADKVNIIAHSQGGMDARFVAHERPDLVASVVTVATPHRGTLVADIAVKLIAHPEVSQVLDSLVRVIGAPIYDQLGEETSVTESLRQLSSKGAEEFNANYPDAPGVFYASVGARSDNSGGGGDCETSEAMPFLTAFNQDRDPVHSLLALTESILDGNGNETIPNDGMVRVKDARWGHLWGCLPGDHFDEVGQIFGQGPGGTNHWKYMDFYRSVIAELRQAGY